MGFFDDIKKVFVPSDEDYEDDYDDAEEETEEEEEEATSFRDRFKKEPKPLKTERKKVVSYNASMGVSQMQVVLCKPERYEDVPSVADHLNENKTVVLNLESANRESSRRIIDFLSGVAYANHGNIKKIANSTFIVTPNDVDVMGELMLDDYESGNLYL